ncbi:hypothetical protein O181_104769 [Austropuccinia psidii MF-1]|uniref:Uncharacterized protein n=1 Tax=Austropuccinia psidii MF-1 TaxID=1389203 RepID=A0A9Q3PKG6_9BASI|nr:hypothetical protein [Austropuccinia psidii MF-1]
MMAAIKTKYQNPMKPNTLKMLSQIKLQILQTLPSKSDNGRNQRGSREDHFTSVSEFEQMRAYDSFTFPSELETFEESFFGSDTGPTISRQDAFINTLLAFNLWEQTNNNNFDVEDDAFGLSLDGDEGAWDPAQVFSKKKDAYVS